MFRPRQACYRRSLRPTAGATAACSPCPSTLPAALLQPDLGGLSLEAGAPLDGRMLPPPPTSQTPIRSWCWVATGPQATWATHRLPEPPSTISPGTRGSSRWMRHYALQRPYVYSHRPARPLRERRFPAQPPWLSPEMDLFAGRAAPLLNPVRLTWPCCLVHTCKPGLILAWSPSTSPRCSISWLPRWAQDPQPQASCT